MTVARRVLVTGASRGIGAATALALAAAGHRVIGASRDIEALRSVSARAANAGVGEVIGLPTDVGDLDQAAALPDLAAEELGGPVEIFVHCAGIARPAPVPKITRDDWDLVLRVNLTSAMVIAQQVVPPMAAAHWGRLVMIGSLYSRTGGKYAGAYTVSKHGVLGLIRVLAAENAAKGITANAVLPGWTDTDMVAEEADRVATTRAITAEQAVKLFLRNQPMGRLIAPEEVGALITFLAGDAAAAITGQAVNIDGGEQQS